MAEITPQKQDEILLELIEEFEQDFDSLNEGHAQKIWKKLNALILSGGFSLSTSDTVKPTAANLKIVAKIIRALKSTINNSSYFNAYSSLSIIHNALSEANNEYFGEILDKFKPKATYEVVTSQAIDNMLDGIKEDNFKDAYEKPIRKILTDFVTRGGALNEMSDLLRNEVLGVRNKDGNWQKSPLINRYYTARRITRDSVFQTMREYTDVVNKDVGFQWFRYSHGTVKDSRKFCKEREGEIFHKKEIESWGKLRWDGRIPSTDSQNIFRLLGGYNCMHDLRPVSERRVPKSVKKRVRRLGFID